MPSVLVSTEIVIGALLAIAVVVLATRQRPTLARTTEERATDAEAA